MKRRKKLSLGLLSALAATLAGVSFAACSKDEQIKYTFVFYDGETETVTGKVGDTVKFPETSRQGYIFKGWYLNEDGSGESFSEATFDTNTTYYAKWAQGYALTLDLDGGSLENSGVFYLEEGDSISEFIQAYTPTKGEYRFGGWYIGEDELSSSVKMTTAGITLTARYKAAYTLNVYLQNEDLSSYADPYVYENDYALIDEYLETNITVEGYVLNTTDSDDTRVLISENKSENVFDYYFDRQICKLIYHANNPDGGTSEIKKEEHISGTSFVLAENTFDVGDYRFLGWATSANAAYKDVIKTENYSILAETVLYAVWDSGYIDMFGGKDKIYLNYSDNAETAELVRGGISINGVYDDIIECYVFEGEDVKLTAKINAEDGTFLYYSNRIGSYYFYTVKGLNKDIKITLDEGNGCIYTDDSSKEMKSGTYKISSDGVYTATLKDEVSGEETTIVFITGTVSKEKVFMVRGSEADYGTLAYRGLYYPALTFNGYGYATYTTTSGSTTYYYTVGNDNMFTLYNSTSGKAAGVVVVDEFDKDGSSVLGFEFYVSAFDAVFTNGDATLTIDGRNTAIYENGNTKITGTFGYSSSLFGGYIVTVTADDDKYFYLVSVSDKTFTEKQEGYAEYRFVTEKGKVTFPYLTINGDGTATLYEQNEESKIQQISTGTIEQAADGSYLYKVTGNVADWATTKATSMVFMIDTTSTSYDVFYLLSSSIGENNTTDYVTVYTATDDSKLKITKYFAIHVKADGTVFSGFISQKKGYISVNDGSTTEYFTLDDDDKTFEQLTRAPLVLTMKKDGKADSNYALSIDGTAVSGETDKYNAVYMETIDNVTKSYEGYYYLSASVSGFGATASVYTFVATDKTFKFTITYAYTSYTSVTYYFNYYGTNDVIEVRSVKGYYDEDKTVTLTDEFENDVSVYVYKTDDKTIKGTIVSKDVTVFEQYTITVYTFTSLDGKTKIKFSLRNSYFIESVDDKEYTDSNGGMLTVHGETNIAKYTTADGTEYDNYCYFASDSPENYDCTMQMYIDKVLRYFDIDSESESFELRGSEAASYLTVKNGVIDGTVIALDGHGLATVTIDETSSKGSYTLQDDVYTVSLENGKNYIGKLGTYVYSSTKYNAFYILVDKLVGSYLNESDLSVLVLDSTGGATKYDLYGKPETGSYMIIKDGLFCYTSSDGTSSFVYGYTYENGIGKINYVGFDRTYYASDFASIVFTEEGYASFNYNNAYYYSYDKDDQKIFLYSFDYENENANEYGFVTEEFTIVGSTITYTDPHTSMERTYKEFNGKYVKFTDEQDNTLEFQPTGSATFSVSATYTTADKTTTSYTFVVTYQDYEVVSYLAYTGKIYPNGSVLGCDATYTIDITTNFVDNTFEFDPTDYTYGITFYDYSYIDYYSSGIYPSVIGRYYGEIRLNGNDSEKDSSYTLSGSFNYLKDSEGNAVTFEGGTLSTAGYLNSNYGNLFLCEFTGSDGNTYHLNFFMNVYNGYNCYLVYSLTLVTDTLALGNETFVYSEQLVYTIFKLTKSTDEATGETVNYEIGDQYLPTLKYKGELICTSVKEAEEEENTLIFESYQYAKSSYKVYYYYFSYTLDDNEKMDGGTISKYGKTKIETEKGNYIYALVDVDNGTVYEIYTITVGGAEYDVTSCVKNEDGTFTVEIEEGTYIVGVITNDDGTQTATITEVEAA